MSENNNKRVALVTGANKGIGFEVARQLAGRTDTVLLGARNEDAVAVAPDLLQCGDGLDERVNCQRVGNDRCAPRAQTTRAPRASFWKDQRPARRVPLHS